jgi:hypothetical protein
VIDMPEIVAGHRRRETPSGRRAVRAYRYGLFRKGNFRFVIDLRTPASKSKRRKSYRRRSVSFRLLLDLTPTTGDAGRPATRQNP